MVRGNPVMGMFHDHDPCLAGVVSFFGIFPDLGLTDASPVTYSDMNLLSRPIDIK